MSLELDERRISAVIVRRFMDRLLDSMDLDVAIVGGGPAGLVAGHNLAREGFKVAMFERKLSLGGGMWGGGMMFNQIVVQEEGAQVLREFGVRVLDEGEGYYSADSVEAVSTLISSATRAGLRVFNCVTAEDVTMREDRVVGLVITWTPVEMAGLHVDPLAIRSRFVIDATGHDINVVRVVERKVPGKLMTPTGRGEGEKSLWSHRAEELTLENTREVFPGLYVAGMSANATFGGPRMGPIFGGMLLSGRKAAQLVSRALRGQGGRG
ncbi:sulfide-dependent adenosine diphosphate thiazole synthase [Thermanaerovibrio acidaminovorans]|uniref:sulfide-dependent adenosine diphosphate thiazole synthase n=1 Tax=Thermanaerovibrio acidaminovorans TaxID=81462 RepID=UPI002FD91B15